MRRNRKGIVLRALRDLGKSPEPKPESHLSLCDLGPELPHPYTERFRLDAL